jgi:hypothetical protein
MHEDDKAGKSRPVAVASAQSGTASSIKGGLSRRQVIQAGALGVSTALVGSMLGSVPARAAGYDPKKYAGTKLSILMTGDENDHRALGDLLPSSRRRRASSSRSPPRPWAR